MPQGHWLRLLDGNAIKTGGRLIRLIVVEIKCPIAMIFRDANLFPIYEVRRRFDDVDLALWRGEFQMRLAVRL